MKVLVCLCHTKGSCLQTVLNHNILNDTLKKGFKSIWIVILAENNALL